MFLETSIIDTVRTNNSLCSFPSSLETKKTFSSHNRKGVAAKVQFKIAASNLKSRNFCLCLD